MASQAHFLGRPFIVVAAVSVNDLMRMTFCYASPYTDEAMVQRIATDTIRRLLAVAESA